MKRTLLFLLWVGISALVQTPATASHELPDGKRPNSKVDRNQAKPPQDIPNDPDPISEGIWFVIQNKSDVDTDYAIPARRLALKTN